MPTHITKTNTLHSRKAYENHSQMRIIIIWENWRPRASSKSTTIFGNRAKKVIDKTLQKV